MGKKRGKDKSFREEEDIDITVPSCRHIKSGTDQSLLKKLPDVSDWAKCQDCKHQANAGADLEEENEPSGIWMCLKCGHRGCGRNSEHQHAVKHYETPRSAPHCLVISMDNWSVWCYLCDDDVQYSSTGYLAQLVTSIKKQSSNDTTKRPQKGVEEDMDVLKAEEPEHAEDSKKEEDDSSICDQKKPTKKEHSGKTQNNVAAEESSSVPVKGLSNLGNTCFFNAVIQSLSQTQLLRDTLNKVTEESQNLDIRPSSLELEPLVVSLGQPGSLTLAMCQLLNEIKQSKKSVVTPRELFSQVCKKAARFKGFQQQDSQELLRYLLDGMRAEEQKRVSTGLLEALKESKKEMDAEALKAKSKEYEKNGVPRNFVDQVFGGEMTSTIMCQQCKTVSVVTEMFLDLSLPVSDEAYRKKNQKKGPQKISVSSLDGKSSPVFTTENENIPTGGTSKYQQKKAKKQAKKQAKNQKRQQKLDSKLTLDSLVSNTESEENPSVEAEATETASKEEQEEKSTVDSSPAAANVSEQEEDESKEQEQGEEDSQNDCDPLATTSSASNRFSALSDEQRSEDGTSYNDNSNADQEGEEETQLVNKMEKVNLDDAFVEDCDSTNQNMECGDEVPETKEYMVVNQDPESAFNTLAHRSSPEKQECSVQSCLFQFTEVETLTQNNSLLCVTCTKRQQRAEGSKKNIYTDALKQMLISSLPAVLTLHLKRFQQNGYSICKVNRHVQFPLTLDLAPYCAAKCKNVSSSNEDPQVLYRLYGIVEHSGTMRSGHYTAYVKVRPNQCMSLSNGLGISEEDHADPATGSWYHISDTSVQLVSETKVQSCQAYLLFYERAL